MAANEEGIHARAGKDRQPNRLIRSGSPYLLQHAWNPVDWHEWGDEAFSRAKTEDKPLFVSIGYSTCHWCHVMERESFERDDVAHILNQHYIAVKVDREERPDLDEIYMLATQLFTGRGGWPNSVWLTPDGRPWFAGTYFPREDAGGRPGFKSVLNQLAEAWKQRRETVERQADGVADAMRRFASHSSGSDDLGRDLAERATAALQEDYDEKHGGFGGAPKFPPHHALRLLAHEYRRTGNAALRDMLLGPLAGMANGGIRDHVGGGFHRYATDAEWFLPHFEKMLYDNALLLRSYAEAWALTGDGRWKGVAEETARWALREMAEEGGGFRSALDADSEGVEGKFYVWTRAEVMDALGPEDGDLFCRAYGIREGGNYREEATGRKARANIPFLSKPLAEQAAALGCDPAAFSARIRSGRRKLLALRNQRVWPHFDDKVLAAWNGLMIDGLAFAGKAFDCGEYVHAAAKAANFVLSAMIYEGRLLRAWRKGKAAVSAYSEDYACMADGLLTLWEADGNARWLEAAGGLLDTLCENFWDEAEGGFFLAAGDRADLLLRTKPALDQASPSANGVAARALIRYASATGRNRYGKRGRETLQTFGMLMHNQPQATASLVLAASLWLDASEGVKTGQAPFQRDIAVYAKPDHFSVLAGGTARVELVLELGEHWHANSNAPLEDGLAPTVVELAEGSPFEMGEIHYPAGQVRRLPHGEKAMSLYTGRTSIAMALRALPNATPGNYRVCIKLAVQLCDDHACQPTKEFWAEAQAEVLG